MKKKRINKIMIIVVLFLFMVMGIGYSYLSKTLGVSGNVTVKPDLTICKDNRDISAEGKLCKRAEKLHTEVCNQSINRGCNLDYSLGDNIIYGNCGVSGELKSGDAFDCDVDGDGVYDSNTERFYYVSDYYDTTSKSFNSDYATLIYYNNVKAGEPNNTEGFAYDASNENWHGPRNGYGELPNTSQWSKVTLLQDTRQLLNEKGEATTGNGSHTLETFTYTDRVARLLTVQELNKGCDIKAGSSIVGELSACKYLFENTIYSDSRLSYGWWTETAGFDTGHFIWYVSGSTRNIDDDSASTNRHVVRPAIDVLKTDILY